VQRKAADDEVVLLKAHDVDGDRLPGLDDASHQTLGDHLLDVAAKHVVLFTDVEQRAVFVVDPNNAGLAIDRDRAFTHVLEDVEQAFDRSFVDFRFSVVRHSDRLSPLALRLTPGRHAAINKIRGFHSCPAGCADARLARIFHEGR